MTEWKPISSAPNGKVVMTKIDDKRGCRNEQAMYRDGGRWWMSDGSTYVYYTPTHFRPLSDAEAARERLTIEQKADAVRRAANRI